MLFLSFLNLSDISFQERFFDIFFQVCTNQAFIFWRKKFR